MPRNPENVFHQAIPCADLDEAEAFYVEVLGCRRARRRDDRVTFDFFGDQLVCHLLPDQIDREPEIYPRHFGVTFLHRKDFDKVLMRARRSKAVMFREPFVRFGGDIDEHISFFLRDPSNNLIEFKHYNNPAMMY